MFIFIYDDLVEVWNNKFYLHGLLYYSLLVELLLPLYG